jgi:hypothetical protein
MSLNVEMKTVLAGCAAVVCALVAVAPSVAAPAKRPPPFTPVAHDALTRALERGELTEAQYALERARSLFSLGAVRREFGDVAKPGPRQATPFLRDLAARLTDLSGADRASARAILSRPTDNFYGNSEHQYRPNAILGKACDATRPLCVHWDERAANRDSPPGADGNISTIPADVTKTLTTFTQVWDLEVATYGFQAPLADDASFPHDGGDGRTDVYLADLGGDPNPFFGYCTTDDPNAFDQGYVYYDVSAYCVVDEDFANFGSSQTRQEFRDVTAAHEFFHAIQFSYDWFEDLWLMEGTAMFMEGQFRPNVEDRIRYLDNSVLTSPGTPVDRGAGGFEYGAWIWWRFLVEDFGELADPLVIRQVWEGVAGASTDTDGTGPDTVSNNPYSLRGVVRVVAARGSSFRALFGEFARVNRTPARFYSEGASYPRAPLSHSYYLGRTHRGTGWQSTRLRHLASRYYAFKPGSNASSNGSLRVRVDLPRRWRGPEAYLLVRRTSGGWYIRKFALDSQGDGVRRVAFGRRTIREVDLVLTNASTRMRCGRDTFYSCAGVGVDDLGYYKFRATVR